MSSVLKEHLRKFITISDEEFEQVLDYFREIIVPKKHNLLEDGQVCKWNYFVTQGLLRKFFINEKGVEQTTQFALEQWWMTDDDSFQNSRPSSFFIQSVEVTKVLAISPDNLTSLLDKHPIMEKYFRCIYQRAYAATQMRLKFMYDLSREELYHLFRELQPAFLQRVPQYLIASYLGFTPEYLSEIRRKSRS